MSLQVWLPLNGDFHNQGLFQSFPNGNTQSATNVFDTPGKIGNSCLSYAENLVTSFKDASNNNIISLFDVGKKYSISCWIKLKGVGTSTSLIQLGGADEATYPTAGNGRTFGLWWTNTTSGSGPRFVVNNGDGGSGGTKSTDIAVDYENWHHFAYTFENNSTITVGNLYIDGEKVATQIYTKRPADNTIKTTASNNFIYLRPYYAMYNDFRIYDHILSLKEVEEIAKGLVLHYKLDNNGMGGENLFSLDTVATNASSKTIVTVNNNIINVKSSGVNYGAFMQQSGNRITFESGITYTLSGHIKSITKGEDNYNPILTIRSSSDNNIQKQLTVSGNESDVQGTYTPSSTFEGYISGLVSYSSGSTNTIVAEAEFSNIKLEKGIMKTSWSPALTDSIYPADFKTTIYDSSGYSNNGTIIGSLTAAAPSPRYDVATQFPGSAYSKCTSPSTEGQTISVWAKWNSIPSGQSIIYIDYKSKTGLGLMNTGILCSSCGLNSYTFSKATIVANTWYHFVVVCPNGSTNATRQLYINGVEQIATSNTSSWSYTIDELQVGKRSTTSNGFDGQLSDFRIYATAFTAEQVKELYNTSMAIDSSGNVYARELVELL